MSQSEQINELASALAKAQGEIKTAGKTSANPFFKSSYADLAAIREACSPALSKNGLAVTQTTDFNGEESWLETTLMHASGQWIRGRYNLKPVKNDPQGMGGAVTYAKRYCLAAMVGVVSVDEDDDGEAASGRAAPAKPQSAPVAPNAQSAAKKWAMDAGAAVRACGTAEELRAWESRNGAANVRLHNVDPASYADLQADLSEAYRRTSVLVAG